MEGIAEVRWHPTEVVTVMLGCIQIFFKLSKPEVVKVQFSLSEFRVQ